MWSLGLLIFSKTGLQAKPFLIGAEWQDGASQAVKDLFWETGCNFARLTGGGYGWVAETHKHALKELGEHGVRVLLQLGSHYPDAKYFDLKDSYFVDQNGKTGVPSRQSWAVEYDGQAWPQYSYASQKFRSELEKDFTAYFKTLGPLDDVQALMVHNEPGTFWLDKRIFDYNPSSIERFRSWLPSQFESIGALNRTWETSFDSFATVEPPHEFPTTKNLASWMDWRRSNSEVIGDFLDGERRFTRSLYPTLPVTTNLAGPIDNWFPLRVADNYRFSKSMDIAAVDIYPGAEWSSCFTPGYTMDMTRGTANGKPVYVAECESYAAEHFPKLSDEQRAARLATDLWTYIGHGANGILVWTLNGQDGFKLTNGEFNARLRTLRDTAYTAKMLNLGDFKPPARKVALVVDRDSYLLVTPQIDSHAWADMMARSDLGMYGAIRQANVETDVISADMVRRGDAANYKALILGSDYTMDSVLAQQLTNFVRGGGLLIASGAIASFDRWGKPQQVQPAFGLDRLFGPKLTPNRFGSGHAVLLAADAGYANSVGLQASLGAAIGNWLREYAGVSSSEGIPAGAGFRDASRLADSAGNMLDIVTSPPNRSEPVGISNEVQIKMPNPGSKAQSFQMTSGIESAGTITSGPMRISNPLVVATYKGSPIVILTARDHSPLIGTSCQRSLPANSAATIAVSVYNPSPRAVAGSLHLVVPSGWDAGETKTVKLLPFGQSTAVMHTKPGAPAARSVVRAVLTLNGSNVEGIPLDVEVR